MRIEMEYNNLKKTIKKLKALSTIRTQMPVLKQIKDDVYEVCKTVDTCEDCPFDSIQPPIHQYRCVWAMLYDSITLIEHM